MKKRLLAVTMMLALAVAAVGCGENKDADTTNSTSAVTEAKSEGTTSAATEAKSEGTTSAATEAKSEGDTTAATEASQSTGDTDFAGSANGKTYTNGYYGVTFTAPEGSWVFSNPSELASRVGKTSDQVKAMTFKDIQAGGVYPAMMCADMSSGESASFILSGVTAGMDEKQLVEATAKALESTAKAEVKEGSPIGSTYYVEIGYSESGVELYMRQYYIFKDDTAATITVTSFTKDGLEKICSGWKNQ